MSTRRIPVAEFKARLSEQLARAREGEEVIITDRGTPVARLVPLAGEPLQEGREARLVRSGLARGPGSPVDGGFLGHPRPSDPGGRALETILEDRGEGW